MPKLPSLLYASPFPPQHSGISAYSACLLPALSRHFSLTLICGGTDGDEAGGQFDFPVLRRGSDRVDFQAFDHVLYNVGNNPKYHGHIYDLFLRHPAPIILHDVVLYYLTVGFYQDRPNFFSRIYQLGGAAALAAIKDAHKAGEDLLHLDGAHRFPLNQEFLLNSPHVFVHSQHALRQIQKECKGSVQTIPMLDPGTQVEDRGFLRQHHGIPDEALVIGTFGIIAPTKQNHVICKALPLLQENTTRPVYLVMVGEGDYADRYQGPRIIRTGYLNDAEYGSAMARCDLVANLRQPSMGETSITLIQAMAAGKACVVSDLAWFAELPDEVVLKIPQRDPVQEIATLVGPLLSRPEVLARTGKRARRYIHEHHRPEHTATALARALLGQPAQEGGR
jgi:glycosyltransferase involved in cell wall biosynthesis